VTVKYRSIAKSSLFTILTFHITVREKALWKQICAKVFYVSICINVSHPTGQLTLILGYLARLAAARSNQMCGKMQACYKLKSRSAEQIASFLIAKYNSDKVPEMREEFRSWGFTKESLCTDRKTLFRFLVLIAYDRQPFDRPDYNAVWDTTDRDSVRSVLGEAGLLEIDRIATLSEGEIKSSLAKCVAHGCHLHNTNPFGAVGTDFSKTIKMVSQITDEVMKTLPKLQTALDIFNLHRRVCTVHGIKETIASKFIMYTVRELGIGNVPHSQLEVIAHYLFGESHNKKWKQRLEDPTFGGRTGLLEQIMEKMKSDPIALDYLWELDRDYCTKENCSQCEL
jgi:hypothetical protein